MAFLDYTGTVKIAQHESQLSTPFGEKASVKALGARWDATQKVWYITDVGDLTPFLRWIPDLVRVNK